MSAQDAAPAQHFVESLYRLYTKDGPGVPFSGTKAHLYFHSSLLALMRADDRAVGPGSVGALDANPVCMCQDWTAISDLRIALEMKSPARALAQVSFRLSPRSQSGPDDTRKLLMILVLEHGNWRIWNVRDNSDAEHPFDVRDALNAEIRQLAKRPKSAR